MWCSSRKHGAELTSSVPVADVFETAALVRVSLTEVIVVVSEVLVAWAILPVVEPAECNDAIWLTAWLLRRCIAQLKTRCVHEFQRNGIHRFKCAHHCEFACPAFTVNTILSFFKQFSPFVNMF